MEISLWKDGGFSSRRFLSELLLEDIFFQAFLACLLFNATETQNGNHTQQTETSPFPRCACHASKDRFDHMIHATHHCFEESAQLQNLKTTHGSTKEVKQSWSPKNAQHLGKSVQIWSYEHAIFWRMLYILILYIIYDFLGKYILQKSICFHLTSTKIPLA